jgi:hypothetical protein
MLIEAAMNTNRLARPLHTFERRGPTRTFDVDGFTLLRDFPTLLFGDGGSLKSFLALYVAGQLAKKGVPVLLVDWELDGEDHRERLHQLFGEDAPTNVYYLRAEAPLVREADVIARAIQQYATPYVILDSVGMATDGPPESSHEALTYFRTLHRIGVRGSLGIAHVTKNGEGADKPFGSVFWHNLTRMSWSARREAFDERRPTVRVVNRKTNLTAELPDVVFEFEFTDEGRIVVSSAIGALDADEPEAAVSGPSIRQRIVSLLQARHGQSIKVSEIAQTLQAKEETVTRTLRRYKQQFVTLPTGEVGLATTGSVQ